MPLSFNSKVPRMVAQAHEVLAVLVLTCVEHFLWLLFEHLLKEQKMLKQMDCNGVMCQAETATHALTLRSPTSNKPTGGW